MSIYSRDRAISGAFHYLGGRAIGGISSFLTILLLVRYMSTRDYASYTAISGLIMLGVSVSGLGLERAISRYVPEGVIGKKHIEVISFIHKVILYSAIAAVAFALMMVILWQQISAVFDFGFLGYISLTAVVFAIVGSSVFQIQSSVLQSLMQQKLLSKVLVVQWGSRLLMTIFLVATNSDISLSQAVLVLAIPEVLSALFAQWAIAHEAQSKNIRSDAQATTDWPDRKGVVEVAGFNYAFNLLAAPPQGPIMRLLIASVCPPPFVAAYGFFQSMAEKARQYLPTQLLYMLIEPLLIAKFMERGNVRELQSRTSFLYLMNLLLLFPLLAVAVGCGKPLADILTSGRYAEYWWLLIPVMIQLALSSQIVLQKIVITATDATSRLIPAATIGVAIFGAGLGLVLFIGEFEALPYVPLLYFVSVIGYLSRYLGRSDCNVSLKPAIWMKLFLISAFAASASYALSMLGENNYVVTAAATGASVLVFALGIVLSGLIRPQDLGQLRSKNKSK